MEKGAPHLERFVTLVTLLVFQQIMDVTNLQKRVIIAFRGTQDVSDVISDVSCSPGQLEGVECGHAHWGFAQVANRIDVDAIIALAADNDVVLTGHSMGGAVALLVALRVIARLEATGRSAASIWDDFREKGHTMPSSEACMHFGVVTLGSPPPLCLALAQRNLGNKRFVLNVVDVSDRVPFLFSSVPCLPGLVCAHSTHPLTLADSHTRIVGQEDEDRFAFHGLLYVLDSKEHPWPVCDDDGWRALCSSAKTFAAHACSGYFCALELLSEERTLSLTYCTVQ